MPSFCDKLAYGLAFLCLTFTGSSRLYAQQPYTLLQLTDSAALHLPLLLQKKAQLQSAHAAVNEARHTFLPRVTVGDEISIGSANDVQGGLLPVAGIIHPISGSILPASNYNAQAGNLASLYAEYDLVNFGLRGAQVDNAIAYANIQQADLDKTLYLVKLRIGKLYFELIRDFSLLNIDKENLARYQSVYTIITALTSSGIKAGVDSSLALAELSKVQVSYNQRSGDVAQLQQQLSFLTGIPLAQLDIDTLLKATPNLAAEAADAGNPLLDYFTRQQQWYASNEMLARKSLLPKLTVGAGGWARGSSIAYNDDYRALPYGLGFQRFNYIGGIGIAYDLVNLRHRRDRITTVHYQQEAAGYAQQQQKLELDNAVAQATLAMNTATKNLLELPKQVHAANDAYEQKVAQYKAGVINLVDLLNASFILYAAQQHYAQTQNDWYNACMDKAASSGTLDTFIQTLKQ